MSIVYEDNLFCFHLIILQATGLSKLQAHKPAELSGGQKQCLAIASALALRPAAIVLDEPTASLDVTNSRLVMETLSRLQAEHGLTILIIEHRFAEVIPRVERVLVMEAGKIIADGEPQATLTDPDIRAKLGLRRPTEHPPQHWKTLLQANGQPPRNGVPLLTLKNVSAGYQNRAVIHSINLEIFPGDFTAVVGDNGAGKSTLARVVAGLIKPSRGKLSYRGGARPRPGLDVSILFQNPTEQLFTDSVEEEVAFGLRNYRRFDETIFRETLLASDLLFLRSRRPFSLSMGQQQRTALAACAALRPQLLILDEPTLGQDWGHLQQLMDFLLSLNRTGAAILLISHDYKLVHHYARRVLLMEAGRIVLKGKLTHPASNAR